MKNMRGFTLIELLVVVAIIGMLSSIVLASLSSARERANDSSVKSQLRTVMTQAALYQSNNNSYGTALTAAACPTSGATMFYADTTIRNAIVGARTASGGTVSDTRCATNGTSYAVSVKLRSSANHWCVDSSGQSKQITSTSWTGVACP